MPTPRFNVPLPCGFGTHKKFELYLERKKKKSCTKDIWRRHRYEDRDPPSSREGANSGWQLLHFTIINILFPLPDTVRKRKAHINVG